MKKATNESVKIARHINGFLNEYVPSQMSFPTHYVPFLDNFSHPLCTIYG